MGLIRYLCGHISGPHKPIPTKFWLAVDVSHHALPTYCIQNAGMLKKKCDVINSVLYSFIKCNASAIGLAAVQCWCYPGFMHE